MTTEKYFLTEAEIDDLSFGGIISLVTNDGRNIELIPEPSVEESNMLGLIDATPSGEQSSYIGERQAEGGEK